MDSERGFMLLHPIAIDFVLVWSPIEETIDSTEKKKRETDRIDRIMKNKEFHRSDFRVLFSCILCVLLQQIGQDHFGINI